MADRGTPSPEVKILDQEPDCVAIIPETPFHVPQYIIVGTYSLVSSKSNTRQGSLQVLPFHSNCTTHSPTRLDFPFGIYHISFHPSRANLLGVATSDAEILFYKVDVAESVNLTEIGRILVEEPSDGNLAIITHFQFLKQTETTNQGIQVFLVATTQFGNTKLAEATIQPGSKTRYKTTQIHQQSLDLEAWTVLALENKDERDLLVLSGGDDSQVLLSRISWDEDLRSTESCLAPVKLQSDTRSHQAGVVSMCDLGWQDIYQNPREQAASQGSISYRIILTGSYDESLRVFLLSNQRTGSLPRYFRLLDEFKMDGGVWRITLLDSYPSQTGTGTDYVLLIAGHTAGAFIARLMVSRVVTEESDIDNGWKCEFRTEHAFTEHESLVYAVAAQRTAADGEWDIVSTSFYDKKICNWTWRDEVKQGLNAEGSKVL